MTGLAGIAIAFFVAIAVEKRIGCAYESLQIPNLCQIWRLIEGDLHSVRVFEAHVSIAPGSCDRLMDEGCSVGQQPLGRGLQVGHLQREADTAADSPADL